jgi:hypothetical protein
MEYFIRQLSHIPARFGVAKFDQGRAPEDVYEVILAPSGRGSCNCPSPKVPCKHVLMVKEWFLLPEPEDFYYNTEEDGSKFIEYSFTEAIAELIGD